MGSGRENLRRARQPSTLSIHLTTHAELHLVSSQRDLKCGQSAVRPREREPPQASRHSGSVQLCTKHLPKQFRLQNAECRMASRRFQSTSPISLPQLIINHKPVECVDGQVENPLLTTLDLAFTIWIDGLEIFLIPCCCCIVITL